MRSPFIFAGLLVSLVGFSINISDAPMGVKYFGTLLCVAGSYAAFPGGIAWYVAATAATGARWTHNIFVRLGNNLAGQYKRSIGMALQLGLGNINGIIASNLFLSTEAPRYTRGSTFILLP